MINAIIYMQTFIYQVLIKRIVEIEMIEGGEIQLGEVSMYERGIAEAELLLYLVSDLHQAAPLFYTIEVAITEIIACIQAEFAYACADIQNIGTGCDCQESSCLPGDFDRCPVKVGEAAYGSGI
jgi:hypothetical protein